MGIDCERDLEGVYCLSRRRVVMHTKLRWHRGVCCVAAAILHFSSFFFTCGEEQLAQAWLVIVVRRRLEPRQNQVVVAQRWLSSVVRQAGFALNINDSCCDGRQLRLTMTSVAAQLKPRCCVSDSGSVAFLLFTDHVFQ
ncbi:unnamed protein product [Prunus armeniaca]